MKTWVFTLILLFSFSSIACNFDGSSGFAPENNLNIPADAKMNNGMTEEIFNQVIDEVAAVYRPIVEARGNDLLIINRLWSNGKVNASASRNRRRVIVNMFGGLARHELITRDGFATVVCHELGHHLGGAPKLKGWLSSRNWASNEGQADYFATLKCFRKVYGSHDNIAFIKNLDVPKILAEKCNAAFKNENAVALCVRSAIAGKSTTDLLASLRQTEATSFDKKDTNIVSKTFDEHPKAQCRLDTYFAAALCDKDMNEDVDSKDPNKGTCNRKDGDSVGVRSLCWYKPKN